MPKHNPIRKNLPAKSRLLFHLQLHQWINPKPQNSAMTVFHLLLPPSPSSLLHPNFRSSTPNFKISTTRPVPLPSPKFKPPKSSINGGNLNSSSDPPKRRSTTKKSTTATTPTNPKRTRKTTQLPKPESGNPNENDNLQERKLEDLDDGFEFNSDDPPLVCCFGAAKKEFLPQIRVSDYQMDPDIYSSWKHLQWDPPEFARAPSGPAMNVAVAHTRLGGRTAFMGKVGDDDFGQELVLTMNKENVQTRGVKFDENAKTSRAYMKIEFDEKGKMKVEEVKEAAEDLLSSSELNIAILKEARMFHFTSEALMSPSMNSALHKAISLSKKFGSLIFFDPNLPLPLLKSRDETRKLIKRAWEQSDIIEVSRHDIEFLLDEVYYERKRNYVPQYYTDSEDQSKGGTFYHLTREDLAPLWHDGIKLLFVTDGTLRLHYYTPSFDGVVIGTEDVLITPFTCDRSGSGDAIVAGIIRKLTTQPEMFENEDFLVRQLRFAISAGIISQWTIGAVRGFPSESAAQNLKEEVYVPSLW